MRIVCLILLWLSSCLFSTAKAQVDRIFECPMNDVVKISVDDGTNGELVADPSFSTTFSSKDSAVYSIDSGVVHAVSKADDIFIIIVQGKDYFYAYSNIKSTSVKNGDTVKDGQVIGYADLQTETGVYMLDMMITKGRDILKLKKKNFVPRIKKDQ